MNPTTPPKHPSEQEKKPPIGFAISLLLTVGIAFAVTMFLTTALPTNTRAVVLAGVILGMVVLWSAFRWLVGEVETSMPTKQISTEEQVQRVRRYQRLLRGRGNQ